MVSKDWLYTVIESYFGQWIKNFDDRFIIQMTLIQRPTIHHHTSGIKRYNVHVFSSKLEVGGRACQKVARDLFLYTTYNWAVLFCLTVWFECSNACQFVKMVKRLRYCYYFRNVVTLWIRKIKIYLCTYRLRIWESLSLVWGFDQRRLFLPGCPGTVLLPVWKLHYHGNNGKRHSTAHANFGTCC